MDREMDWNKILNDLMVRKYAPISKKQNNKRQKKENAGEEDLAEIAARIKELQELYNFNFSDNPKCNTNESFGNVFYEKKDAKNNGEGTKNSDTNKENVKLNQIKSVYGFNNMRKQNININFNINNKESHVYYQTKTSNHPKQTSRFKNRSESESEGENDINGELNTSSDSSESESDSEDEDERARYLLETRIKSNVYRRDREQHVDERDMPSCSGFPESIIDQNLTNTETGLLPTVSDEDVNAILSNYNPKMVRFMRRTEILSEKEKLQKLKNNEASRRSRAKAKLRLEKLQKAWIENARRQ